MSRSLGVRAATGATPDDIARIWHTLIDEYIPNLKIEVIPKAERGVQPYILVQVVDYALSEGTDGPSRSVWSEREYHSPIYLISHNQLFDLLITAHRVMDEFFTTGVDNRPRPAKG